MSKRNREDDDGIELPVAKRATTACLGCRTCTVDVIICGYCPPCLATNFPDPFYKCECEQVVRIRERTCHRISHCEYWLLKCVHCNESVERDTMEEHLSSVCSHRIIVCEYAKYGCPEKVLFNHQEQHRETNSKIHEKLIIDYSTKLEKMVETTSAMLLKKNIAVNDVGDADGQYNIGMCFATGEGVDKNLELAFHWFQKSADQGNAVAQNHVGYCYKKGEGVEMDLELAFHWFQKSADQGNAVAQKNLGFCYTTGEGVEKNLDLAFHWYKKSAEQGNASAQNNLGVCYYNGEGVEKNLELAFHWFQKSAEQCNADAQNHLGCCYKNGKGVEKNFDLAFHWFQKSAEHGNAYAQNNLGICYEENISDESVDENDVEIMEDDNVNGQLWIIHRTICTAGGKIIYDKIKNYVDEVITRKGKWMNKSEILQLQCDQNKAWHWSKNPTFMATNDNEGRTGCVYMRKNGSRWEMKMN